MTWLPVTLSVFDMIIVSLYIELAISYPIGRQRTVNFQNRARDVIAPDYTIIMSSSRAFVLLAVSKEAKTCMTLISSVQYIIKQLLDEVFVISRII